MLAILLEIVVLVATLVATAVAVFTRAWRRSPPGLQWRQARHHRAAARRSSHPCVIHGRQAPECPVRLKSGGTAIPQSFEEAMNDVGAS
ncbi:MAG: hypothetical protein IPI38_07250 [Gemmatimonadetes bacterium]|jgi:hypothetical protein|nr:hypothetical protein [Gemmatimonadota bacterium]MBP6670440.1 hypothetical protein [Gemmatimonadales bacterium]MBK6780483.1 hypothetical protein [Gemmatimonadota bacterium]MBK7351226.1 hypothetical protein [Gemmatimonadota bacterium]MBK7715204.1 hypothetical protein [Gemmatimonadota bacterium]